VVKVYQSLARPYIILAHTFERGDLKKLNAEIDAAMGVWSAVSGGSDRHCRLSCFDIQANAPL
jgi:hypothetical protein